MIDAHFHHHGNVPVAQPVIVPPTLLTLTMFKWTSICLQVSFLAQLVSGIVAEQIMELADIAFHAGLIPSVWFIFGLLFLIAALLIFVAYGIHKELLYQLGTVSDRESRVIDGSVIAGVLVGMIVGNPNDITSNTAVLGQCLIRFMPSSVAVLAELVVPESEEILSDNDFYVLGLLVIISTATCGLISFAFHAGTLFRHKVESARSGTR